MRRLVPGIMSLLSALALALPAGAAGDGLKLGPVLAFPSLAVGETYDDNVFLASEDATEDWITTVTPALRFALPLERFYLQVGGEVNIVRYADNTGENSTDWNVGGAFGANFPGGLSFELSDTYRKQYVASSQEFPVGEDLDTNTAGARVGFAIRNAFKVEVSWFNNLYQYEFSARRERDENVLLADLYWKFLPKTSALLEFGYSDYAYDSTTEQDNAALHAALGVTWDYTARSTGIVKVGLQNKTYADEDPALGYEDASYAVATVSLRHLFTRRTTGELEISQASQESDFQENPYYLRTRLGVGLSQRFTPKLYARLAAQYHRDAYPNETTYVNTNDPGYDPADPAAVTEDGKRTDSTLRATVAFGFDMLRWLNLELGYVGERRGSTYESFEYTDNQVAFTVKAAF